MLVNWLLLCLNCPSLHQARERAWTLESGSHELGVWVCPHCKQRQGSRWCPVPHARQSSLPLAQQLSLQWSLRGQGGLREKKGRLVPASNTLWKLLYAHVLLIVCPVSSIVFEYGAQDCTHVYLRRNVTHTRSKTEAIVRTRPFFLCSFCRCRLSFFM